MKKIAIIGKFNTEKGLVADGQTIKTTILASEIENLSNSCDLMRINTFGWKRKPFKLFADAVSAVLKCDDVILMTDAGGIKVFPWLLRFANFKRRCKLHYAVVGGWLVHVLKKHRFLTACLKKFNAIYVETSVMKKGLEELQFKNTYLMKNCKPLIPLTEEELVMSTEEPYKLCIFSRIMREKGIEEAVNAVKAVNKLFERKVFCLDIYGQVDDEQTLWFEELRDTFPSEIRYCGVAPYDKSVEILKPYFALLFPTKFYTEGIPGTIIDAYAAGVPVIATEWESFSDVVVQDVTGVGYPFSQPERLNDILIESARDSTKITKMKKNCLVKAGEYLPQNALGVLWDELF